MKLCFYELLKIVSRRNFIFILILLLFINLFFAYKISTDEEISPDAYKRFYRDLQDVNDIESYLSDELAKYNILLFSLFGRSETELVENYGDKAYEYIDQYKKGEISPRYTKHYHTEQSLFNEALKQFSSISAYGQYIDSIEEQAEQMLKSPIFGEEDSFSYRNIKKTPLAYSHLRNNKLKFGNSEWILALTNNKIADFIALILVFYICFVLFIYEDENGLFKLIRPAKRGNYHTLAAKTGALFIFTVMLYLLLYGSLFLLVRNLYGMDDLTRKIQSVRGFLASNLDVTISAYLIIYSLSKIVVYFLLGMTVLTLCILFKNMVAVYLASFLFAGVNLAFFKGIDAQSAFGIFRYISFFSLFRTNSHYENYINVNLFGYPVNLVTFFFFFSMVAITALLFVSALIYLKQRQIHFSSSKVRGILGKLLVKRAGPGTRLILHEGHRILLTNKVLFILLLLFLFQGYNMKNYTAPYDYDDNIYKNYLQQIEGGIGQHTHNFIKNEEERFKEIEEVLEGLAEKEAEGEISKEQLNMTKIQLSNELYPQKVLQRVKYRVEELERIKAKRDFDVWLVYDTGYNALTGPSSRKDYVSGIIMTLLLTLCLCPVFATEYDKGLVRLVATTKQGRSRIYGRRTIVCIVITLVICLTSFLADLVGILRIYGAVGINAPVQSLEHFSSLTLRLTIGQYLALLYCLRLVASMFIMFIIFSISILSENTFIAIAISQILFIVPLAAGLLGVDSVKSYLFNPLITVNILFWQNNLLPLINSVIVIAAGLLFVIAMYRKRAAE
ncbi:MAG TPA: hypothetical protein VFD33_04595 [Bacillota bacterium]|nr:hypothetical protein [Bacillota bacterium]